MEYLFKAVAGAGMVLLIALLAKSKYFFLAGLAPLFPTFALFSHVLSYQSGGETALREVAFFGLLSIFPYATYLISVIMLAGRVSLWITLCIALLAWATAAVAIVYIWKDMGFKEYIMGGV